jgi:hypothetical protein
MGLLIATLFGTSAIGVIRGARRELERPVPVLVAPRVPGTSE